MIAGIGLDLVYIPRVREMMARFGERFLNKVFLPAEIERGRGRPDPAMEFAALFAAKEAVMKALGTGMGAGVRFKQIEIINSPRRPASVNLTGRAREIAELKGVGRIMISITHEQDYAAAHAVMVQV